MKFALTHPVTFGPGTVLGLTKEQVALRSTKLSHVEKNRYSVTDEVHFKLGEVIEVELEHLPRAVQTHLAALEAEKKRRNRKAPVEGQEGTNEGSEGSEGSEGQEGASEGGEE